MRKGAVVTSVRRDYDLEGLSEATCPPERREAALQPRQILDLEGGWDERAEPKLTVDELHTIYRAMLRVRAMDTKAMNLHRQGRIGFYVPSFGEEAAQIGSAFALAPQDWIFPAYREQGAALLRGYPLEKLFCQFLGNGEDLLKGRQMPNHFGAHTINFATASSPVGTQIVHAVGGAYASRLRGEDAVSIVYFGDGATSSADFHAGMNFAAVWNTPTIFFCKNNGYAISLPVSRQTATATLAEKGLAYGIPGVRVDGNDVLAVYQVTKEAIDRARSVTGLGEAGGAEGASWGPDSGARHGDGASGNGARSREVAPPIGPTLIEAITYRMGPHSSADDPTRYRDAAECATWQARDPISRFRGYLERKGIWSPEQETEACQAAEAEVNAALRWAEKLPPPDLATLVEDVFVDVPWHLREQLEEVQAARNS
jgi:pyruvate dehydrogenase E1 component alpha subunit